MFKNLQSFFVLLFVFVGVQSTYGEDDMDLLGLSFEELRNIKVRTSSLSKISKSEVPASVTTITQEDIAVTPHRNLVDLINVYVPGAFAMNHGQGPKLGIRGVISSSNVKFLLLINGRNITEKVKNGIIGEIDQWNLQDIHKIEIIRGPGSVIYGSGAVGGVINIITKTSSTFQGTRVGYLGNSTYRGNGGFMEYGMKDGDFGLYAFMSLQKTRGQDDPDYYAADTKRDNNFVGQGATDTTGAQPYMADSLGDAQIKMHLDMSFGTDWRWWTRYTRSGQLYDVDAQKVYADGTGDDNKSTYQGFITTLTNHRDLNDTNTLFSTLSYDTHEFVNYNNNNLDFDEDDIINRKHGYSEHEVFLQSILNSEITDKFTLSLGGELSYEWVRAPWGEGSDDFLVNNGGNLISGENSNYIGNGKDGTVDPNDSDTYFVGNGWEHTTYSFLSEASYEFDPMFKASVSLRADKHELSDWAYSPRLALISTIDAQNTLKFITQRSIRNENTPSMVIADQSGGTTKTEEVDSFELIYMRQHTQNLSFTINTFYNDIELMAFNGGTRTTDNIGNLQTAGFELEVKYETEEYTFGGSHSFTKQLDFTLDDDQKTGDNRNGISYADYLYSEDFITLDGEGNDLNNWANQATKFYVNYRPNKNWILHANAVIYWGMPGAQDELDSYKAAYDNVDVDALSAGDKADFLDDKAAALAEIDELEDNDAFEMDFRLNASVTYKFKAKESDMALTLYMQNLLGMSGNKNYHYNTGSKKNYPNRASYTEEPFAVGLMFTVKF
jgi:outer membrane receptor protein involved in Fe transport